VKRKRYPHLNKFGEINRERPCAVCTLPVARLMPHEAAVKYCSDACRTDAMRLRFLERSKTQEFKAQRYAAHKRWVAKLKSKGLRRHFNGPGVTASRRRCRQKRSAIIRAVKELGLV
jgi:hypothetical protein